MFLRQSYPKLRLPMSHFFLTVSRGDRMRTVAIRPLWLYLALVVIPLLCLWYLAATLFFIFRDDMLISLARRNAELQYAYEDRLAAMRSQLDRVTSRQLLDQDTIEGKVHELISRQAQLEGRETILAMLADQAGMGRETQPSLTTGSVGRAILRGKAKLSPGRGIPGISDSASAGLAQPNLAQNLSFAPVEAPPPFPSVNDPASRAAKPRPENDMRSERGEDSDDERPVPLRSSDAGSSISMNLPVPAQLTAVAFSLDRIENTQLRQLSTIEAKARHTTTRLSAALTSAGLSPDKLAAPGNAAGKGGPFVPMKVDPKGGPFEREVSRLQDAVATASRLRQVMPYVPLRQPLPGDPEVTSGFGLRSDPFLGRLAMHSGVDFREDYGAAVLATAGGRVITAGPSGGYGNLVEIEHGNGLTTRYGHLSSVVVEEGQWVENGAIVGRLGSSGRSTGPHLHYETRIDGDAVDPLRFLRAGARLPEMN